MTVCETMHNVGTLRLRSAEHPVSSTNARRSEASQAAGQWNNDRYESSTWHEPLQTGRRRWTSLHIARRRPVSWHGSRQRQLSRHRSSYCESGIEVNVTKWTLKWTLNIAVIVIVGGTVTFTVNCVSTVLHTLWIQFLSLTLSRLQHWFFCCKSGEIFDVLEIYFCPLM